jgi:hypothetical protein
MEAWHVGLAASIELGCTRVEDNILSPYTANSALETLYGVPDIQSHWE